jgi:5'-methylthioadenosine phosphorylase
MSAPLGIIGGSAFLDDVDLAGARSREVTTPFGTVVLRDAGDFVFVRRHGEAGYRPPHRIPHHAHVAALESLGVASVIGFASVGALHDSLHPGSVVIPNDYLSQHPPPTFAGDEYLHIVPSLDEPLRALALAAARAAHANPHDGGVYAETRGPRFETRAEIRMLAPHADVVGMTAASEATLLQERGIRYAIIAIVDNWANGIGPAPLTLESFQEQLARNASIARTLLHELLHAWRAQTTRE